MRDEFYRSELEKLAGESLNRELRAVESPAGRVVQVDGREKIVFASNNYLGLAGHPAVIAAAKAAVDRWGIGAGASRLICGHSGAHAGLERRLAAALKKDKSLVFPSGYQGNLAVLSTLPQKGDLIAIDKLAHASLIDGAMASEAQMRVYPHGHYDKLRRLLDRGGFERAFIVSDSLFSMDGDFSDLAELVEIKRRYDSNLILDEAHAFGCLGPAALGLADQSGLLGEVDIFIGTFSKAIGAAGGFVASSEAVIDYLINRARPFIFSTGMPAAICETVQASLGLIASEPQRRERLLNNATRLRERCVRAGLNIGATQSYIVPVILGSAQAAVEAASRLWDAGYWAPAIRPPAVAPESSRLRLSVTTEHTEDDIDGLTAMLGRLRRT